MNDCDTRRVPEHRPSSAPAADDRRAPRPLLGVNPASAEGRARVDAMTAEWADLTGRPDSPDIRSNSCTALRR